MTRATFLIPVLMCFAAWPGYSMATEVAGPEQVIKQAVISLPPGYSKAVKNWPGGNLREVEITDPDGHIFGRGYYRADGTLEKRELYDVYGHKTAEALYETRGKMELGPDGWAGMTWQYDGYNLEVESYYDETGSLMKRKFYDHEGQLVDTRYIGDEGLDPDEEMGQVFSGWRNVEYYNDDGTPEIAESVYSW